MAARAVADVAIHTGEMTLDEAAAFYEREAGMSPAAARGEAVKNSMFPRRGDDVPHRHQRHPRSPRETGRARRRRVLGEALPRPFPELRRDPGLPDLAGHALRRLRQHRTNDPAPARSATTRMSRFDNQQTNTNGAAPIWRRPVLHLVNFFSNCQRIPSWLVMVPRGGLEPPTARFSVVSSTN